MQTTRGTSLSDEGDKRGTSAEPSATGEHSDEGDKRGTSAEPTATGELSDEGDKRGTSAEPTAGESQVANSRRRHLGALFGVAVFVIAADLISKIIVVAKLSDHAPIRLLGGLVSVEETRNPGAAFSIGTGATLLFGIVAVAVIIVILRTARRLFSRPWSIVLGLLLGGATGNLIDRLVRSPGVLRGHVVDWISVPHFAVFNLADSSISIGGVLAVLLALSGRQLDGRVVRPSGKPEAVVTPASEQTDEQTDEPSETQP